MTPAEKKFVDYWQNARRKWNWGKTFKQGVLYLGWPAVIIIDLINYLVIGDTRFSFISFGHLFNLLFNLMWVGLVVGFAYGFFSWANNEQRYWSILKKDRLNK